MEKIFQRITELSYFEVLILFAIKGHAHNKKLPYEIIERYEIEGLSH